MQQPYGCRQPDPPGITQFLPDEPAEGSTAINLAVAEEVFSTRLPTTECQEHRLHHIADIDEGDVLPAEAYGKIHMPLDGFCHQEIVALARSIDSCRAQCDAWQPLAQTVEIVLGLELALSVGGIGLRSIALANLLVGLRLTNSTEDTERAQIDKPLERHLHVQQRIGKVAGPFGVDTMKIVFVQTLRHTCRMNHIIERGFRTAKLLHELRSRIQIKLYETDTGVAQIDP